MKISLATVVILLFIGKSTFAQEPDTVIAQVFYTLSHQQDTAKKDSIYKENMVLSIGKNASLFSSFDKIEQAKAIERNQKEQTKNWNGPGLPVIKKFTGARKITTSNIFQFQKEKKSFIKEFLIINYLYEEPFEEIKWELTSETKSFDQIKCQKATARFKGRQWIAWFAPDIPFETGPWKLHGLPGLILEAYDSHKEVQFLFAGLESIKPTENEQLNEDVDDSKIITLPKKTVVKIKLAESKKIKESMYKDPKGFFTAQIDANGGLLDTKQYAGLNLSKINNPIDLTENK